MFIFYDLFAETTLFSNWLCSHFEVQLKVSVFRAFFVEVFLHFIQFRLGNALYQIVCMDTICTNVRLV